MSERIYSLDELNAMLTANRNGGTGAGSDDPWSVENRTVGDRVYATPESAATARAAKEAADAAAAKLQTDRAASEEFRLRESYLANGGDLAGWERDKEEIKAEMRKQATIRGVNVAKMANALRYG